ncbi:MAG: hypothetical protein JKY52_15060 [Flavobacteriales bacterium]|nr:hypothetical protein [Flavobacteriales bacterium]
MKTITTTTTLLDLDKNPELEYVSRVTNFGTNGLMLDETDYNADSNMERRVTYRYFADETVKEAIIFDAQNEQLERLTYEQNNNGEVSKSTTAYSDGTKIIKTYSFTDLGNASKVSITDESGTFLGKEIYVFDEEGRVKEEIEYDGDDQEILRIAKKYSDEGLLLKEISYFDKQCQTVEYHHLGNIARTTVTKNEVITWVETSEFNNDGAITKTVSINRENNDHSEEQITHNENGFEILVVSTTNGKLTFKNSIEYDQQGRIIMEEVLRLNWQGRIETHAKMTTSYDSEDDDFYEPIYNW